MNAATVAPHFSGLAESLLLHVLERGACLANADLINAGQADNERAGSMDAAFIRIQSGDLAGALTALDAAITAASLPPGPFTVGSRAAAGAERACLLMFARTARVLVLDALKAPAPATRPASRTERD